MGNGDDVAEREGRVKGGGVLQNPTGPVLSLCGQEVAAQPFRGFLMGRKDAQEREVVLQTLDYLLLGQQCVAPSVGGEGS